MVIFVLVRNSTHKMNKYWRVVPTAMLSGRLGVIIVGAATPGAFFSGSVVVLLDGEVKGDPCCTWPYP